MRTSRRWIAGLTVAVLLSLAVAVPRMTSTLTTGAETLPSFIALDCDVATEGVQSDCAFPAGTTSVDVDVVLGNNSAVSVDVAAFNFEVRAPQAVFAPLAGVDANLNANPDFADFTIGTWSCTPPVPSADRIRLLIARCRSCPASSPPP